MHEIILKTAVATVHVAPSMGAAITHYSIVDNGTQRNIFRDSIAAKEVGDSANFPLIPFSNRVREGQFGWCDKRYQMPLNMSPCRHTIHGLGWQSAWQVEDQSEQHVILTLNHKGDSRWPFAFNAKIAYRLDDWQLHMSLQVNNQADIPVPMGLGFHPYFTRTESSQLHAGVSGMWQTDDEVMPVEHSNNTSGFENIDGAGFIDKPLDNVFTGFNGFARLDHPQWRLAVELNTCEQSRYLVVYHPISEDFICLEPVSHGTDALNQLDESDNGMTVLAPNQVMQLRLGISPKRYQPDEHP